jgi:terminal uridylyltransferase
MTSARGEHAVPVKKSKERDGKVKDRVAVTKKESNGNTSTDKVVDISTSAHVSGSLGIADTSSSASSSIHTSPLLRAANESAKPTQSKVEGTPTEGHQKASAAQTSTKPDVYDGGPDVVVSGIGIQHLDMGKNTYGGNNRTRASTSTLPSGHAALLNSLPSSAYSKPQGATAAKVSSSSGHYRPDTLSGTSSAYASLGHTSLQSNYYLQPHFRQQIAFEKYTVDLTNCLIAFLSPLLPTEEEYRIKEATRRQLEKLAGRVSSGAKLLAFGSMANGFALKNSGAYDETSL